MIKKYWIYAFFLFAVALFSYTFFVRGKNAEGNASYKTFQTNIGWGYDVFRNDSLFIHQEYMPALDGRQGFRTEQQASQAAKLVITKLKGNGLPMVTREEIGAIVNQ